MTYVLGIDIGGTFTDAFASDDSGRTFAAKVPTTPEELSRGVVSAVKELAANVGVETADLLSQTSHICHGTTSALNALVTGAVAKVGFITTRGHADSISIMNLVGRYAGLGHEQVQRMSRTNKPRPLVHRSLIREIDERVDYKGAVIAPLDEEGVRAAIEELLSEDVEAIAVSLLWSFRNDGHEQRVRELIHELAPGTYVALSSEISPRIREYPRSSTTIMSTQIGPKLKDYLVPLEDELRSLGFGGSLLVMQGSGGAISARDAVSQPISTVASVLTGGLVGALNLGRELGHDNIITTDIGGTTFLVGMIVEDQPLTSTTTVLNQHQVNLPMVRISTIGSGGGAIAWLDAGGNLRVGPRSAGAHPGPACYGEGGAEPTVTDADLVLGVLDPDYFLGGRKRLDVELAEDAIRRHIAEPLGLDVPAAASAVAGIQNSQTADLLHRVVLDAGYDPRDFVVYSFGGAGPVHCAAYSADLGAKELVVPLGNAAAAFSAYGLAAADVSSLAEISDPQTFPPSAESVTQIFERLEAEVRERLDSQGIPFTDVAIRREADLRYSLQMAEVSTPVPAGTLGEDDILAIGDAFEDLYERRYGKGAGFREAGLQVITYRVYAEGQLAVRPSLAAVGAANGSRPEAKKHREVLLDPGVGPVSTPIYDYAGLLEGHELSGPAIVEAPTTTVVIPEGAHGTVDRLGNIIIDFSREG